MADSLDAGLIWEEQQRADRAQKKLEHRKWLKDFALALVLIVLTITAATVPAGLGTSS